MKYSITALYSLSIILSALCLNNQSPGFNQINSLHTHNTTNRISLSQRAITHAQSSKRGIVGNFAAGDLNAINAAWYYMYGPNSQTRLARYGVPYVGMVFCLTSPIPDPAPEYLLGYNEPDAKNPSSTNPCKWKPVTPEEALTGWPLIEASGAKYIGSPAMMHSSLNQEFKWLPVFFRGNGTYVPRVDFIPVHWYGFNPMDFLAFIDLVWVTYGKPIWITEFSMMDEGVYNLNIDCIVSSTNELAFKRFLKIALAGLESRDYVHRYSWYSDTTKPQHRCYSLFNLDGTLTKFGEIYGGNVMELSL